MQEQNKSSFFDPKTIFAVVLVAAVWFGWQTYLTKKYPNYNKPAQKTATKEAAKTATPDAAAAAPATVEAQSTPTQGQITEKEYQFQDQNITFTITNHGMGLKNVVLNKYIDYEKKPILLGQSETDTLFEMKLLSQQKPLEFDLKEEAPGQYVGVAQVGTSTVTRTLKYDSEKQAFTNKVVVENPNEQVAQGLTFVVPEKITVPQSTSWLFPSYQHQDFFVKHNGKTETVNFSAAKENVAKQFPSVSLVSVSSQYFAAAILDKSEIIPETSVTASPEGKTAKAELIYKPAANLPKFSLEQIFFAGPKNIETLKHVDAELPAVIDHGFFEVIARPLLYVMKACFSMVGNWGIAIILLTLLVRFCVLPFAIMSAKSMKAMQKIQPLLQNLREKYKNDPMALNRETMALMKEHKANPLGGCLPMLLQIPIFFALYRVIGSSIELYHSPFYGWITDLSSPDKFFVLPILVGLTMFLQQKMTPTTMDPAQAKIMAFLPLVFTLFMLQLPSGLALYMTVSAVFGIVQQYFFLKDSKKVTA
ncbi:membrane protein insertase YidC [Bdellovibrio sp. HCB337]|uniref:membrane protein insertase YidC n=1 Tax=Bdellovibrio sp. HCB337 TaxID=3394358 RepID=UPI0039A569A9